MNIGKSLIKSGVDIICTLSISEIFNLEFVQDLILMLFVVVINTLIIPLLKKLYEKIGIKKSEEEIKQDIENSIKEYEEKKGNKQ